MEKRAPFSYHGRPNGSVVFNSRGLKMTLLLMFFAGFGFWQYHRQYPDFRVPGLQNWSLQTENNDWKVPLEIHIMSKCPDARDCLLQQVVPTMALVASKVNFTLSFIGTPTEADCGVACMHGPDECLGNILELCAAELYPDPKLHLGFTACMSRRYVDIPQRALVEDCAFEHGIEFDRLNDCASSQDGAFGMGLLRESVMRSSRLNVTTSCTVRLDHRVRCIRDGGRWKNCDAGSSVDSLVGDIEKLYAERNG